MTNAGSQSPDFQKSLLISTMGPQALQISNGCDPADTDIAENILTKLGAHILGDTNETFERYKFNTRAHKPDESIDGYLVSLKTLAKTCNFCECLKTSLLRDRICFGRDRRASQETATARGQTDIEEGPRHLSKL